MKIKIEHRPAYAVAVVSLEQGEKITAENGSMVSMNSNISVETTSHAMGGKGLLKGLKRLVGGESWFNNIFTAQNGAGEVVIAPTLVGDIREYNLTGNTLIIQSKSYLASGPEVSLDTQWGGARSFFAGEGLFMLKASGIGPVLFNAFGGIHEIDVNGNFIVDTGHIVAFEDKLTYRVKKVGGWFATIFSGEGLVAEFNGNGKLWIQTRNPKEFGSYVGSKLPAREN
ncbi:MAG: TIGR00266 family protein [Myxococcota bacterium]